MGTKPYLNSSLASQWIGIVTRRFEQPSQTVSLHDHVHIHRNQPWVSQNDAHTVDTGYFDDLGVTWLYSAPAEELIVGGDASDRTASCRQLIQAARVADQEHCGRSANRQQGPATNLPLIGSWPMLPGR